MNDQKNDKKKCNGIIQNIKCRNVGTVQIWKNIYFCQSCNDELVLDLMKGKVEKYIL